MAADDPALRVVAAQLQRLGARARRPSDLDGCLFCGRPAAGTLCGVCAALRDRLAARHPLPAPVPATWVPRLVIGGTSEEER